MTTTLTERDKRLLRFIGIAGFLVLFAQFALRPAVTAYFTARQNYGDAVAQQEAMQYNIDLLPTAEQSVTRAKTDRDNASAAYYEILSSAELDSLVTGLELDQGLAPLSMTIGTATADALDPYVASAQGQAAASAAAAPADTADSAADSAAGTEAAADGAANALTEPVTADTAYMQTVTVSCTASGTREQFAALLEDLNANHPAIRVDSFSISDAAAAAADGTTTTSSQFSLTLAISMCDRGEEAS